MAIESLSLHSLAKLLFWSSAIAGILFQKSRQNIWKRIWLAKTGCVGTCYLKIIVDIYAGLIHNNAYSAKGL